MLGESCLNDVTNHCPSNLLFFFPFLRFDVERKFWTRYLFAWLLPRVFAWLFFGSGSYSSGHCGTFLAHIGGFFYMSCQINLAAIYSTPSCFRGQFTLQERNFWDRHPFAWLFCWFKKRHCRPVWHIFATHRRFFWITCPINLGVIIHILYVFAVNLTCWRANFEIAILSFDFFIGSKSDISGSFGTILSIFTVNVIYWRSNFDIPILFFDFFLGSKNDISGSFGTILADIGGFFLNDFKKSF